MLQRCIVGRGWKQSWKCYRRYQCFVSFTHDREAFPSDDKPATTSGAKCAVVDETCSCFTCDSSSVFGRKPTGNSAEAGREKVLFEDYDVCAYHIIVAKPPATRREEVSSNVGSYHPLFARPLTTTTITFIKRWRHGKNGDKCLFTEAYHSSCTSLSWRLTFTCRMRFHDSLFVLFLRTREWLYGSMIVYKFVIKLSANKESGNKINFKRL